MAIYVKTKNPKLLLDAIKTKIKDKEYKIRTWEFISGSGFNHKAEQYTLKAFLKPSIKTKQQLLEFSIRPGNNYKEEIGKIFEGRFISMLKTHFQDYIDNIETKD